MQVRVFRRLVWCAVAAVLVMFPNRGSAQTAQSTLYGRVLDPMQATVAHAQVSILTSGASVYSGSNGEFSFTLDPGQYRIRLVAKGFLDQVQTIDLRSGSDTRDFVLQLSALHQFVTVTDSPGDPLATASATKTPTPFRDIPQSIAVVTQEQIRDQSMTSIGDIVRYVPGVTAIQGENNRDQIVIRGVSTSADFFVNGVRDDVQYYRDPYNLERMEILKGPNALIFGRGGGGGVVDRVTKEAGSTPHRELTMMGGSFGDRRFTGDVNQPIHSQTALRLNAMLEDSESFRNDVRLKRYGINPTLTLVPDAQTRVTLSFEHLYDRRGSDRGIPSFQGRPADMDPSTFFGNPAYNDVWADVNLASAKVEHRSNWWTFRNQTVFGDYDRGYQNFVPGAVDATKTSVALTGYNNATKRRNIFNQTDLTYAASSGRIRHTILAGTENGLQFTDNFRNTAFFNNTATSIAVPYTNPVIDTPVTFRQSATDADNHVLSGVNAVYLQDQAELSRHFQAIGGLRFDHFDLKFHNNRTNESLRRIDNLVSPRAGIVYKPAMPISIYGSYSISYLPGSGDQFSSLTTVTQQVKPEKFNNYEAGIKWDVPYGGAHDLSITTAVYRLDRLNTRATDPNDPSRIIQTGKTRSRGYEMEVHGKILRQWKITGGYAWHDAVITSATVSSPAGAAVAQTPHHTFSMWNNYQITGKLGAGLGLIHRSDMYAAVDDTVTLPGYIRADAAVFYTFSNGFRLQMNAENLANTRYIVNADGNNNISPGAPRTIRIGLTTKF